MMTCRELVEQLGDYASDSIEPGSRRGVEAHLMSCDRCLRYLGEYGRTVRLARKALG